MVNFLASFGISRSMYDFTLASMSSAVLTCMTLKLSLWTTPLGSNALTKAHNDLIDAPHFFIEAGVEIP